MVLLNSHRTTGAGTLDFRFRLDSERLWEFSLKFNGSSAVVASDTVIQENISAWPWTTSVSTVVGACDINDCRVLEYLQAVALLNPKLSIEAEIVDYANGKWSVETIKVPSLTFSNAAEQRWGKDGVQGIARVESPSIAVTALLLQREGAVSLNLGWKPIHISKAQARGLWIVRAVNSVPLPTAFSDVCALTAAVRRVVAKGKPWGIEKRSAGHNLPEISQPPVPCASFEAISGGAWSTWTDIAILIDVKGSVEFGSLSKAFVKGPAALEKNIATITSEALSELPMESSAAFDRRRVQDIFLPSLAASLTDIVQTIGDKELSEEVKRTLNGRSFAEMLKDSLPAPILPPTRVRTKRAKTENDYQLMSTTNFPFYGGELPPELLEDFCPKQSRRQ